ncbi:MAG: hypothetical protein ABIO70_03795 [Pseudomonadota bacterium]
MSALASVLIMIVACVIVCLGWFAAAGLVLLFVQRRVKRLIAEDPAGAAEPPDSALLFYALSVFFWPAGFVCGAYFLKGAKTARQGRTCVAIGLGYISVITLLTCAGMVAVAWFFPGMLG